MRLLVVDDDANILQALEKGLKKEGYAIDVSNDGDLACEFLEINSYDLVVLDINLPGVDGFTILKKLRKNNTDIKVIIISANRTIDDRIEGLDLGANDYLVKPFDFQELKARIRALLRRDFVSKPNLLTEGKLKINLSTHEVSYEQNRITLTLKEYSILKYLVQNKGKIISSEELFQHIWNDEADPFSEVMRVHIYSLRKKISSATGNSDMITTVKGCGYLFNAAAVDKEIR